MLDQPVVGQLALRPQHMRDEERLDEIGEILAVGLIRVRHRQEHEQKTQPSKAVGDSDIKKQSTLCRSRRKRVI